MRLYISLFVGEEVDVSRFSIIGERLSHGTEIFGSMILTLDSTSNTSPVPDLTFASLICVA